MNEDHVASLIWFAFCNHSEHGDSFPWDRERIDACNALLSLTGVSIGLVCEIINQREGFAVVSVPAIRERLATGEYRSD